MDRMETWKEITAALALIADSIEVLSDFELREEDIQSQLETINIAVQKVRAAAHEYLQPDK